MKSARFYGSSCILALTLATATACHRKDDAPAKPAEPAWQLLASELPSALLSVSARSAKDVFVVGADKGDGPVVLHFDGAKWAELHTGQHGDLWWVQALPGGPALFGGAGGMVLRYDGKTFERMPTPGLAKQTVFGVWGTSGDDFYAVGSAGGRSGFVWHFHDHAFEIEKLPVDLVKTPSGELPGFYKAFGSNGEVWVVGANGTILHRKAAEPFALVASGTKETIFTISGSADHVLAVGGSGNGLLLQGAHGVFHDASPPAAGLLQGVFSTTAHGEWTSGERGAIYTRANASAPFAAVDHGLQLPPQSSLHSITVDDEGGVWSAGGNVLTSALGDGMLVHYGQPVSEVVVDDDDEPDAGSADSGTDVSCPADMVAAGKSGSIARRWNEQALAAIRLDTSRPTVQARTLYHLSAALWDAWAAYDPKASGVFAHEKAKADDVAAARTKASSYAAYDLLKERETQPRTQACLDAVMKDLGLDPKDAHDQGDDPIALGHRVAHAVLKAAADDGANEANDYVDPDRPVLVNTAVPAEGTGRPPKDPAAWTPLSITDTKPAPDAPHAHTQVFLTSQWGGVRPFALAHASFADASGGPHPRDSATKKAIAEMLAAEATAAADAAPSPEAESPITRWNVVANEIADAPGLARKAAGRGDPLDPLAWDVRVYLALNGALHDAAIASWSTMRQRPDARPVSLVRWMGAKGQATDPHGPSYDPDGLSLVPDLVAVVTRENSAPGAPLEALAPFVGQIAVRSWRGEAGDPSRPSGVAWIRAVEWSPFAPRSFVSPAWPGTVATSAAFATAGTAVLATLTAGDTYPDGTFAAAVSSAERASIAAGFELAPAVRVGEAIGRSAAKDATTEAAKLFAGKP